MISAFPCRPRTAIADYATMYLLGSPRRLLKHEKLAAPSIMTLFKDGPRAALIALTRLDRAYLQGLYTLKPNSGSQRLAGSTKAAYARLASADCDKASTQECPSGEG